MSQPTTTAELLPKKLYPAELVILPFFWLAPLSLLVLGGAIAWDFTDLDGEYELDVGDKRYYWYLSPFILAHLGTLTYRYQRRRALVDHLGLKPSTFQQWGERLDVPAGRPIRAWVAVQLLGSVVLVVAPSAAWLVFLAVVLPNAVVGPLLVWFDLRSVRQVSHVEWGWPRHFHVLFAAIPIASMIYLLQRQEHVAYAALIEAWNAPPDERTADLDSPSRLERWADRVHQVLP